MARRVAQIGHLALKAGNKKVTDFGSKKLTKLIQDLKDTMRKEGLVGMAAPQIGENYRVFVTEPRKTDDRPLVQTDKLRVYINPKILHYSARKNIIYEGCGSVLRGGLFGPVKRPTEVTVVAFDQHGDKFQLRCDGLLARVIQHEYDHINGIEFLEKVHDYSKIVTNKYYRQNIKHSQQQIAACKITVLDYRKMIGR